MTERAEGAPEETRAGAFRARIRLGDGKRPHVTIRLPEGTKDGDRAKVALDLFTRLRSMARRLVESGHGSEAARLISDAALASSKPKAFLGVERAVADIARQAPDKLTKPLLFRELCELYVTGELAKRHPRYVDKKGKADQTRERERCRLALLCQAIGDVAVCDLTFEDAERAMRLVPSHASSSWRRSHSQPLFHLMKIAHYPMRLVPSNPIPSEFVDPLNPPRQTPILYPKEERILLGNQALDFEDRLLWGIQNREGFRPSGGAFLRWSDLDLVGGTVTHMHKTGVARMWMLGPDVLRTLRLLAPQATTEWVFPRHATLTSVRVNAAPRLRQALVASGLVRNDLHRATTKFARPMRAHDLRTSFCTLAWLAGKGEEWIMARTGHTTSLQLARYKRLAKSIEEMAPGWFAPLDEALGLTGGSRQPTPSKAKKGPVKPSSEGQEPSVNVGLFAEEKSHFAPEDGLSGVGHGVGQTGKKMNDFATPKTTCYGLKGEYLQALASNTSGLLTPTDASLHESQPTPPQGGPRQPSPTLDTSEDALLESLRTAAHAAVERGDWGTVKTLGDLIDAHTKRAPAPVSAPVSDIETARRKRDAKKDSKKP